MQHLPNQSEQTPSADPGRAPDAPPLDHASPSTTVDSFTSSHRKAWTLVAWLAVIFGAFVRFAGIGRLSIWYDEGYTWWMAGNSPSQIIRLLRADTAPPLYYLLLHYWTALFGFSETAMRSMSACFSIATLALVVPLARRLIGRPAGAAAAAWILALSLTQTQYAQEARFYALMAFEVMAMLYCMVRYSDRANVQPTRLRWITAIILLGAASLYTHNMMIPYLFALGVCWFILPGPDRLMIQSGNARRIDRAFSSSSDTSGKDRGDSAPEGKKRFIDGLLIISGVLAFYSPWALGPLASQIRMVRANFWPTAPSTFEVAQIISSLAGVRHLWLWDWQLGRYHIPLRTDEGATAVGLAALALSIGASTIVLRGARRRAMIALGFLAFFPPLSVAIYSRFGRPIFIEKVFVPSAAILPIFIMMPLAAAPRGIWRAIACFSTVLFLAVVAFTLLANAVNQEKEDWRQAAAIIAHLSDRRRLIVLDGNDGQLPFDYYYRNHIRPDEKETGVPSGFFDNQPPRAMMQATTSRDIQPLANLIRDEHFDEVILILSHDGWADKNGLARQMLLSRFGSPTRLESGQVRDIQIEHYAK